MIKNYIKIAIRNMFKQKAYSILNLLGLAVGLASAILILLWVKYEFSYNNSRPNKDRIFIMGQTQIYSSGPFKTFRMPGPLAADIKKDFPEVEFAGRLEYAGKIIRYEEKIFNEQIIFGDKDLFSIFSLNFTQGNIENVFSDYYSIVISEKITQKYFENENPIGKILTLNDTKSYKITGVFEDIPKNSNARFNFCIPFEHLEDEGYDIKNYGNNSMYTWIQISEKSSHDEFNNKLIGYYQQVSKDEESQVTFWTWPLNKVHLYSIYGGGLITTIYIFIIVASFILIIACINFMNLATARSTLRSKEIGLRKVLGAVRKNIIKQFMGESIIMTLISIVFACIIVILVLPTFNIITSKELSFSLQDPVVLAGMLILTLFTALIAGSYPALYLSAFKPISVLKGTIIKGKSGTMFRRILVVFQFTLSIALIIGTIIIQKQLSLIENKDIGLNKENVVVIRMKREANLKFESFKASLLQNPKITYVSRSGALPIQIGSNSGSMSWEGKDESQDTPIGFVSVGYDFEKTSGFKMVHGRFFSKEYGTDSSAVVINESTAKLMGIENPVGNKFTWGDGYNFNIIGVVKDFNFEDLSYGVTPLAIYNGTKYCRYIQIKISDFDQKQTTEFIEETWTKLFPTFPFAYSYLEDDFVAMYERETQTNTMFKYFAILAIIISCLGLFGLASYMAEQKTKEIGVRKAIGGSVSSIVFIMSKEFIKWVVIANILAWPLAWYFGNQFLDQFANRANISADIFILAGVLSIAIALLTISYQSIKAAKNNPIDALRYE